MTVASTLLIYATALPLWIFVWWTASGFELSRENRTLWFPFLLCLMFLLINALLVFFFGGIGEAEYEESRFVFIGERAMVTVQATASVLIVATIVYGLSIKRVPVHFIRFMVYAFIAILGLMAPIVWVPIEAPEMFFLLRHLQTIALTYGLFLCVAGIIILLKDLLTHGDARLDLPAYSMTSTESHSTEGSSTSSR